MVKEWFTVKECLELPGFPRSAPGVRSRLNTYSKGKEGAKRKREVQGRGVSYFCVSAVCTIVSE